MSEWGVIFFKVNYIGFSAGFAGKWIYPDSLTDPF